jgi:hypothetical protein
LSGNLFGFSLGGNFLGNYIEKSDKKVINLIFNNDNCDFLDEKSTSADQTVLAESKEIIIKIKDLTCLKN